MLLPFVYRRRLGDYRSWVLSLESGLKGPRTSQRECPYRGKVALGVPLLHLFVIFGAGNLANGRGELHRPGGPFNLTAKLAGEREQLGRAQFRKIAAGQFGFDLLQLGAKGSNARGDRGQPFLAQGFEFDRLEILDLELMFAAPRDERGFGNIEFGHEAGIGPALRAQFDETMNDSFVGHTVLSGCCRNRATAHSANVVAE